MVGLSGSQQLVELAAARLLIEACRCTLGGDVMADAKPIRIVIYVDGGVVQDVLACTQGVEAMIVDFDSEKVGEPKSSRSFEPVAVNPEYIEKTIESIED